VDVVLRRGLRFCAVGRDYAILDGIIANDGEVRFAVR
jgi:hypothetical protein